MKILKGFKYKLNNKQKIYVFVVLFVLIILSFGIPSLARIKNRLPIDNTSTWDGTVSSSYRRGTGLESDPYIISNAKELAYFSTMLLTNSYKDTYFKLENNIIINNGLFNYVDFNVTYTLNNTTFYIKDGTNEFYDNVDCTGIKIGTINIFESLDNFEGYFDGNNFTIFGLFIKDNLNAGLFTNLNGNVENLYIKNSYIEGDTAGGIASTSNNSTIKNVMVEGIIKSSSIGGGIIGVANNTSIENTINKSTIISDDIGSGLMGRANGTTSILQSYNTGTISGIVTSGLIGNIEDNTENVTIIKSFNKGEVSGKEYASLIGTITNNTGTISINRVIDNTDNSYMISIIVNSTVNVDLSYKLSGDDVSIGTINGTFTNNSLFDKTFMTTLGYDEFVDNIDLEENGGHVWIYEEGELPILYLDDIVNPIASLHVSNYSWNNIGYILDNLYFNQNIPFTIQEISQTRPLTEIYYHIENSDIPLTKSRIDFINDWEAFSNSYTIFSDGKYIIYVKAVSNDQVYFINSDVLIIDSTNPTISINNTWNTLKENINETFIDSPKTYSISATDENSGIKEISYYLSNEIISNFDNIDFIKYETPINITEYGSYIIYARVIDNAGNTTYVNSDMIKYGGYTLNSLKVGRNNESLSSALITDKSSVIYNFTYSDNNTYKSGYYHKIVSNINLPINTKLTLIDNITNEKYVKVLSEETNSILFNTFSNIGLSITKNFIEKETGDINEDYSLIVDFSNTEILSNINSLIIQLKLNDTLSDRGTIASTLKPITIYTSKDAALTISTSFNSVINYNSNSSNSIPLSISLNYNYLNNVKIHDTTYEDKEIGIYLKMTDNNGNTISKEYLKNIKFKIGNNYYYVSDDGIVRIKLNNGLNSFNDNLIIETSDDNSNLSVGNYYFKIYASVSYDGKNSNELSNGVLTIPINNNVYKYNYNFNVIDNNEKIINKEQNSSLNFSILQNGNLSNPNIRVSLYKKKDLTSSNQDYEIVDIKQYISNNLEKVSDNIYYIVKTPLDFNGLESTYNDVTLNLINNNFDYNSYRFIFELYDNNTFISKIGETFIAK